MMMIIMNDDDDNDDKIIMMIMIMMARIKQNDWLLSFNETLPIPVLAATTLYRLNFPHD